jgi:hypothetical protein
MAHDPTKEAEQRFLAGAFKTDAAVKALSHQEAGALASRAVKEARGFAEVDHALRSRGLVSNMTRARGYTPFSTKKNAVHHVSVIPYTSPDPKSQLVGTLGISDGEPASGVVTEIVNHQVTQIWIYDFIGGKLVEKVVPAKELAASGPAKFNDPGPRDSGHENISSHTSASIAMDAFKSLLIDDYTSVIYSLDDIKQLAHTAPVVSAIAELQHMRHLGTPTANACCSCCTCSWGCCSSCSATASTYVNNSYYQWQ